jgi:hypothetical protein
MTREHNMGMRVHQWCITRLQCGDGNSKLFMEDAAAYVQKLIVPCDEI